MEEQKVISSDDKSNLNESKSSPNEINQEKEGDKDTSKSLKETDLLLKEASEIMGKETQLDFKQKSTSNLPIHKQKTQEAPQNEVIRTQFWRKTTTWKKRKKLAEAFIMNSRQSDEKSFHTLAFKGDLETLKTIYDEEKQKLFSENKESKPDSVQSSKVEPEEKIPIEDMILQKNSLGLTPLIFAIWGEQNREDEEKKTSKFILGLINDQLKKKQGQGYEKFMDRCKVPFDSFYKNEVGHVLIHDILNFDELNKFNSEFTKENFGLYNFISEDFDEAVSYCIETQGFQLVKNDFRHAVCYDSEPISIVAFALRVKSIQCANLLFNHVMKNITKPEFSYMLDIIQSEMSDYLAFNSVIIEELLLGFTNIQEKSLPVNIESIPKFMMIWSEPNLIENQAYNSFDDMPDAHDFIKSQIINSKIRLPSLSGSEKSLKFIQRLASTENLMLFRVTLIKSYLQYKWENMWPMIFFQSLLMWVNIPLIILLVFVNKYDLSILIAFTVINTILTLYELFQFTSMDLFQYFGNIDKTHSCLGIRFVTLFLIFLPNFQPYSCTIYLCISACLVPTSGQKKKIIVTWFFCGVFICFLFPAFWVSWEFVEYLMMGIGSFLFLSCCILSFIRDGIFFNIILRVIELPMLIVVLFMIEENFGIMILTQFIIGITFCTQLTNSKDGANCCKLLFDLFITVLFSINFYTTGMTSYYVVNSLALFFAVLNFLICLPLLLKDIQRKDAMFFPYILPISIMIGFNLEDGVPLKIFVIVSECFLLSCFAMFKVISPAKIIRESISMVFSWNSLDLARIVLCIVWLVYQYSSETNLGLTYSLVTLILIRGLTGFRCFKMTRYYVRLILNSIRDILPFILIFFYSTLSFGIICSIYRDISLSEIWMYPYDLNIGAASHDNTFDMNYISFFVATVINVIIMLNLLISILGDSFDRFQVSAAEIDFMEMAQTLAEFETMLFWRRSSWDSGKYLVGILNEAKGKKRQGKITRDEFFELKDFVGTMKDNLDKQFELSEKNIMTKVFEKFEENDEKLQKVKQEIFNEVDNKILASEGRVISALERLIKSKF